MTRRTNQLTRLAVASLLILAGFGLGYALLGSDHQQRRGQHGHRTSGQRPRPVVNSAHVESGSEQMFESRGTSTAGETTSTSRKKEAPPVARVICVDSQGEPVGNLPLRYWGGQALINDRFRTAVSGSDGRADLPIDRPGIVYVEATSEDWELRGSVPVDRLGEEAVLTARPLLTILVSATVTDGRRWKGACRASISDWERWRATIHFDERDFVKLTGVPAGEDLTFRFSEHMIGVDLQSITVPAARIRHLALIPLTLDHNPESEKGLIEVNFTNYGSPEVTYRVRITKPDSSVSWANMMARPGVVRSTLLVPGEYVVGISGEPGWQSEPILVKAREVTTVTVEPYLPATVSVRVVDETGEPMLGAVLSTDTNTYISFRLVKEKRGIIATTDLDGNAVLAGLRPGAHQMVVAAEGYEPHVLEVELSDGEERTLPKVQLMPATGRISVVLEGMRPKQPYTVALLQPLGVAVEMRLDAVSSPVEFTALPLRKYVVVVMAGRGGLVVSKNVELSTDHPASEITLVVTDLEESAPTD